MTTWLNFFLFGVYPYICLTVCVVGCLARFDRSQYSWRAGSSEIFEKRILGWASPCFHVSIICLLLGHAVGLLTPPALEHALGVSPPLHQLVAASAGAVFAALTAVGGAGLLYRRFFVPSVSATSCPTDKLILVLLYVQLWLGIFGLPHSFLHAGGSTMDTLGAWCRGILTFRPGLADLVTGVPWIYKLHLVLGMTLILLVPFTRLVHVISVPIWYVLRPGWQIVRRAAHLTDHERS